MPAFYRPKTFFFCFVEMCDAELQDRIITCVSNVVESASSYLHSGWRPLFATLRSIKVPFLIEVVDRSSRAMSCPPEASVEICLDGDDAGEAPVFSSWRTNQLRVKTVLDIVEVRFYLNWLELLVSNEELSILLEGFLVCR